MSLVMPSPVLNGKRYYLRVRVPRDLLKLAHGRTVHLPVAGVWQGVKVGSAVKLSLDTADAATAKARFGEAYAALLATFEAMGRAPAPLTHKQMLALAGEIRSAFIDPFDDNPGTPRKWANVLVAAGKARRGETHPFKITLPETIAEDMERRYGPLVDIKLAQKGLAIPADQRPALLDIVAKALDEAAVVNLMKADGDYSNSGATTKYPAFVASLPASQVSKARETGAVGHLLTFTAVIDERVRRRSAGKDAMPMRDKTVEKYRITAGEFSAFRKSDDATMVTAKEADAWMQDMLAKAKLSNRTIGQRIQNLRTVIQWAREHSLGELYQPGNPLDLIKPPAYQPAASDETTYTMDEAVTVLLAARKEAKPTRRWLPWLCAYSGARINEVAQLTRGDFFEVGDDWFYRLTTAGGKTLKNAHGIRNVPVHPALMHEGLLDFVKAHRGRDDQRLFLKSATQDIVRWVRGKAGVTRKELAPNHGWRHLFEDLCTNGGVTDAARSYMTGRSTGRSSEGYGKSQAMLPGLAMEMRKVPAIPLTKHRA